MTQPLSDKMLTTMQQEHIKEAGLVMKLNLKDGDKRSGVYKDVVMNPLNNPIYKDTLFVKLEVFRPQRGLIVYVPVTNIESVVWAQEEDDLNGNL